MKLQTTNHWILLGLVLVLIVNLAGCGIPALTPVPLPSPDPLTSEGDMLYSLYRKGLITRHISANGRLLQRVALASVDPATAYDNQGRVRFEFTDGTTLKIPIDNVRYSQELIPGQPFNSAPRMWMPVIAPIKYPGYRNDGYFFAAGDGDNPGYYGGMALATFSLEAIHEVSPYSIEYARSMVRYFLDSEMWPGSGYIVRQARFFNSNENGNNEPILRGASAEELLGIMLGLMFYLEAEEKVGNTNFPLYGEARALQHDILQRVPLLPYVCLDGYPVDPANYKHPFMRSAQNSSYDISHFAFPLYASAGVVLQDDPDLSCGPKNDFFKLLAGTAGRSATFVEIFKNIPFDSYAMYLAGMILILESDHIPNNNKKEYAEIFMRDFIKAANTHGPDVDALQDNAYWSVVALLVNKYLDPNKNPLGESAKLRSIWGDKWQTWVKVRDAHNTVAKPITVNPGSGTSTQLLWQHNLPLMAYTGKELCCSNYNPEKKIGKWFVWKDRSPYYWHDENLWETFPGTFIHHDLPWGDAGSKWNVASYASQSGKKYHWTGFFEQELLDRGHVDNQVEGAGLDLLFMRMLLTDTDPETFPPPQLTDKDKHYPLLPFPGIAPNSPQFLQYKYQYYSKDDKRAGKFKIEGDQDQALRIVTLGDDFNPSKNFVVAYATDDEILRLMPGFVSDGYRYENGETIQPGIYVSDERAKTAGRFDKVELARTEDDQGNEYIVVAERAEKAEGAERDDHWFRLSLWRIDNFGEGHVGELTRLAKWVADDRDPDAVEELDLTILNKKYAAVIFRGNQEKNRLAIFELDFKTPNIELMSNQIVSEELYDHSIGIEAAYQDVLIYTAQYSSGWRLASDRWIGNERQYRSVTSIKYDEKLLDMTTVKRMDYSQPEYVGGYYVVLVTMKDRHLKIYSWQVTPEGMLVPKGEFNTVDGEDYLVGREADWERASISSLYWNNRSGFVIVGKGVAREVRNGDGDWQQSAKGLKVVYGYIMEDGRPTLESSNVLGSGDPDALRMLDVSGGIVYDSGIGVVTAHKTKDDFLMLVYWLCRDNLERYRWRQ